MKTVLNLLVAGALVLGYSSCKSLKDLSKQKDGDDVYYSMKDAKKERAAEKKRKEEESKKKEAEAKQQQAAENNAKAMATSPGSDYYDEAFDYDDYYDYEYAARLRRFNHPVQGNGYYDNYYTNTYYYNQNPNYYGASVYNSYNFWGPSAYAYNYCPSSYFYYNSGWPWGTGMNYGYNNGFNNGFNNGYYDPWANNGWGYNPYYTCNSGWNGGWYGPMTSVYSNYWGGPFLGWSNGNGGYGYGNFGSNNGNNNYYFNSYDDNSYYYGPRHSASSSDGRPVGSGGPAFGERFAASIAAENNLEQATREDINRIVGVTSSSASTIPSSDVRATTPANGVQSGVQPQGAPVVRDGNASGNTVPPPPSQTQSGVPACTTTSTPPAPDYSQPRNDHAAPAQTQTRSENGSSPNVVAPSNSGGGSNGGAQPRGNSGPSGTPAPAHRPR